jgi:hypothetical protein
LKEKPKAKSTFPREEELEEEELVAMLCFFIDASKASIFLKHLDSK